MKRKIVLLFLIFILSFGCISLSGCSSGVVGIYVLEGPNRSVYAINEPLDLKGIEVKGINSDGTIKKVRVKKEHIENNVDMSTSGVKNIVINVDGNRTAFPIYVPHYSLTPEDDLKETINKANEGEIIYLKEGIYKSDQGKFKDVVINKSLIIIGEDDKTTFCGNFIVGIDNIENYNKIELNKVEFYNIDFKVRYGLNNGLVSYEKPYENTLLSAIQGNDTKGLYVKDCSFDGYSYAINMDNAKNLSVIKNEFKNIKISALKTQKSTLNTSVYENVFMDIGENTLFVNEKGTQNYLAAIDFSFDSEENSGVIIANNTFVRIGLKNGEFEAVDENSLKYKNNKELHLSKLSYVNNSAIIILSSSNGSNLKTRGIILSFNSYGTTLNNIIFGTDEEDFLNESAVIINNN